MSWMNRGEAPSWAENFDVIARDDCDLMVKCLACHWEYKWDECTVNFEDVFEKLYDHYLEDKFQ